MIENTFATDTNEAFGLLNIWMFIYLIFLGILPSLFIIFCKIKKETFVRHFTKNILINFLLLIIAAGCIMFFAKEVVTFGRVNKNIFYKHVPYSYIRSSIKYIKKNVVSNSQIKEIKVNLTNIQEKNENGKVMIMVIGETARDDNFSLYGYPKQTNPNLEKEDLFIFDPKSSCGTSTAMSVPCIFYPLGGEQFRKNRENIPSYIHYLKNVPNLKIIWYDNNFGGCYANCDQIENYDLQDIKDKKYCHEDGCVDGIFLEYFKRHIKEKKAGDDLLIIFHQNGSHGPLYYNRYPQEFEYFTPTCKTNKPQNCSKEELINSYDNTILYTDYVLSEIIKVLKEYNHLETSMIYASDHGESLGENGFYLHGMPLKIAPEVQKDIPMILWLSNSSKTKYDEKCIEDKTKTKEQTHDELVNSMLGFFNIESNYYQKEHDIFAGCNTNIGNIKRK